MGTVSEFHDGRDQADDQGGIEFIHIMMVGVVQIAEKEAEIQCQRQYDEECEKDFLQVHNRFPLVCCPLIATTVANAPVDNKPGVEMVHLFELDRLNFLQGRPTMVYELPPTW